MCDAGTLDIIGTVVQVGGAISQSRSESKVLRRQADLTKKAGEFELARFGEETDALRSRQRVARAKSGVGESGSILDVQRQSAEDAELEALNIQFGAGAGVQSRLFEAKQVERAGQLRAVTSVLGGLRRRA